MKKLTIILALIPLLSKSQISTFSASPNWTISQTIGDNRSHIRWNQNDSLIGVYGDTIAIIKYLVKENDKKDSIIESQQKLIRAAIKFLNNSGTMPTENNCYWPALLKQLRRNGYSYTKSKQKNICTNK